MNIQLLPRNTRSPLTLQQMVHTLTTQLLKHSPAFIKPKDLLLYSEHHTSCYQMAVMTVMTIIILMMMMMMMITNTYGDIGIKIFGAKT